jgi:3-oxoacyl-[acyl-carrier-protein] synthase-1
MPQPWRGVTRLVKMSSMAVTECLAGIPATDWPRMPLLLCLAERQRPGRLGSLDHRILFDLQRELNTEFAQDSSVLPYGRASIALALRLARELIETGTNPKVLILATDSLIVGQTLRTFERSGRLLTPANSNGFAPGEGAAALLVGADPGGKRLLCTGIGLGTERAHIESGEPLRGEGLTQAIRLALDDAACEMRELDFRITDLSGEQYYFKEAALALARTLRVRKPEFDLWHPAECIGDTGSVSGAVTVAVAEAACRKTYGHGPNILCHFANDGEQRAAIVLQFRES